MKLFSPPLGVVASATKMIINTVNHKHKNMSRGLKSIFEDPSRRDWRVLDLEIKTAVVFEVKAKNVGLRMPLVTLLLERLGQRII